MSHTADELGLTFKEQVVLMLHDKPPQELSQSDKLCLRKEVQNIRESQMKLLTELQAYCITICK